MKIERFKSILLVLLVISSIVLTVNKWFNKKLWPEGYNFFSDVKTALSDDKNTNDLNFNPTEIVLKPSKIIINNSGNHVLYTKSSSEYKKLYNEIKSVLEAAVVGDEFVLTDNEEWNNTLKSKSCFFSYPVVYNAGYFFSQISKVYSSISNQCFEFVITFDPRISSVGYLYMKDVSTDEIYKKKLEIDCKYLIDFIDKSKSNDGASYYSFELNFDSEKDGSVEQPILIDPNVLISITGQNINGIYENNIFDNLIEKRELYSDLIAMFGYDSSTFRKYVETDNTMVFVENYGSIKLLSDGFLNYRSVDKSYGVTLEGDTPYDCINSCISFVNLVCDKIFGNSDMYFEISSDIYDINSKNFVLTFDYYVGDNMIIIPEEKYGIKHAVVVEVSDGNIVSYSQVCKEFALSDQMFSCLSAIDAIDGIQDEDKFNDKLVSDIFMAYTFDEESGVWYPTWHIKNSDNDVFMMSGKVRDVI